MTSADVWPRLALQPGESRSWRLGALHLEIVRELFEWRVDWRRKSEPGRARRFVDPWPKRLVGDPLPESLELRPALADRPIVVRPNRALTVAPGASLRLYVTTPLWIQIRAGESSRVWIDEPSHRPPDTWFGPSTTVGELAYSSRTNAVLDQDLLGNDPLRATTPICLLNRGSRLIEVSRINLPVGLLQLWARGDDLWTETLTIHGIMLDGDSHAELEIGSGAPKEVASAKLLAPARIHRDRSLLQRTFGSLVG